MGPVGGAKSDPGPITAGQRAAESTSNKNNFTIKSFMFGRLKSNSALSERSAYQHGVPRAQK